MRAATLLAVTAILWVAPAAAQSEAAVQKLDDDLAVALNKADATAVAKFYAEDAVLLPPGAPKAAGRSNIQKFWKETLATMGDVKLVADDVASLGPKAAQEIGHFSGKTKGNDSQDVAGKYVIVWRKVGQDWKIATDIWNFDK
jgi:uncharacterized protein (TIGR02246 family)